MKGSGEPPYSNLNLTLGTCGCHWEYRGRIRVRRAGAAVIFEIVLHRLFDCDVKLGVRHGHGLVKVDRTNLMSLPDTIPLAIYVGETDRRGFRSSLFLCDGTPTEFPPHVERSKERVCIHFGDDEMKRHENEILSQGEPENHRRDGRKASERAIVNRVDNDCVYDLVRLSKASAILLEVETHSEGDHHIDDG